MIRSVDLLKMPALAPGLLAFFILLCLALLLRTLRVHRMNNAFAQSLAVLEPAYDNLIRAVRFGSASVDDIKRVVLPRDFPAFERFLIHTISSVEAIDVRAERHVADASGFTDVLIARIKTARKWEKALAVRVLANFRDPRDIPLFREILAEDDFPQTVFAACLGLALCKDSDSIVDVGRRVWSISEKNPDALLLILRIYGKKCVPISLGALGSKSISDSAKAVILDFLGEGEHREAAAPLEAMLREAPSEKLVSPLLAALRKVGSKETLEAVLPFLAHRNFMVRIEAVATAAELGGPGVLPVIEKCLGDENGWVRNEAAKGMARLGTEGVSRLRAMAERGDGPPGAAARTILAELRFHRLPEAGA